MSRRFPAFRQHKSRAIASAVILLAAPITRAADWYGYAHDAQHTAISPVGSQNLGGIRWQTPVDLNPQYTGGLLYAHYGSALFTPANTAIVPVKTGASGGFRVEGRDGATGTLLWSQNSGYTLPPHNWVPPFAPTVTATNRLYMPEIGGQVAFRNSVDSTSIVSTGQTAFFGDANYISNPSGYNSSVFINTPITSDAAGNIYFGYTVNGFSPLAALGTGGVARISSAGVGTFVKASTVGGSFVRAAANCAPALSNDGSTVYIALATSGGTGSLVALNASNLATVAQVPLTSPDPAYPGPATVHPDGTSAVTVGPDGKVFYGVLENSVGSHNYRGWMTQFTSSLGSTGHPVGSFGWDITPSIVPASMVPSYTGSSTYLLMTKYNNYKGIGDGVNKIAILDPNDSQPDPLTPSVSVMKEVLSIAGVTPDPTLPAVREWCINTTAIDPITHSVLANSEDGKLYRWDTTTNSFTQNVTLTAGIGEAYTPTLISPDGTVYAVNNAQLFAVGNAASTWLKNDSISTWSSPSSWTGGVPSGVGAVATFGSAINAARTVNVDSPRTVGSMNFVNASSYTIAGSTITLDANAGTGAWVTVATGSHNIAAPLILSDDTTFNIIPLAQSLKITDLTATGRALTKYGEGTLEANRLRANSLAVNVGKVKITPAVNPNNASSNSSASVLPSLTVATGAQLDLTNTKLITQTAPAIIQGLIQSGRNGGSWNGSGIITSQTAALGGNYNTLGVARASDTGISTTAVWAGQTVSPSDTLVMYTYGGDATLDGKINIDDYIRIDLGISAGLTGWSNGDFNYSGAVDIDDYLTVIDLNIGTQGPAFATAGGAENLVAVPEPAGMTLLTLAAMAACRPRRRRQ